ncbi:MAG: site-specific integrase, partial [Patescibacteria group bacterium]
MDNTLHKLKQDFLEYLEIEKNRSQATIKNYDFYLQRFINWAKISKPSEITQQKVKEFRLHLNRIINQKKQPLKKSTQNYHIIALRSFLKYLAKQDVKTLAPEKIELAKVSERQVEFLEGDDLNRILQAPLKVNEASIIKKRDKAIL